MSPEELFTTTVRISKAQSAWLMTVMADIRRSSGAAVDRSAILRALVDAVAAADMDFSGATTEHAIKRVLIQRLKPRAKTKTGIHAS